MQQNAKFIRKLPIPMDIKKEFPVTEEVAKVREARVEEMRAILDGRDSRLMLRHPSKCKLPVRQAQFLIATLPERSHFFL